MPFTSIKESLEKITNAEGSPCNVIEPPWLSREDFVGHVSNDFQGTPILFAGAYISAAQNIRHHGLLQFLVTLNDEDITAENIWQTTKDVCQKRRGCLIDDVLFQTKGEKESDERLLYFYRSLEPQTLESAVSLFPSLLPDFIDEVRSSNIWIGRNCTSKIHVDALDNFLCCLEGQKIVHFYSPWGITTLKPKGLETLPVESSLGSYLLAPGDLSSLERKIVVLQPGDVLYIPGGWWHEVFTIPEVTVAINFWCDLTHAKLKLRPTLLYMSSAEGYRSFFEKENKR